MKKENLIPDCEDTKHVPADGPGNFCSKCGVFLRWNRFGWIKDVSKYAYDSEMIARGRCYFE